MPTVDDKNTVLTSDRQLLENDNGETYNNLK